MSGRTARPGAASREADAARAFALWHPTSRRSLPRRYARFFGPGVRAELRKVSSVDRTVELTLITMEPGEEDKPLERLEDGTTEPILSATEEERRAKEQRAAAAAAAAAAADAAPVDAAADA